jgi:hypothetical protein
MLGAAQRTARSYVRYFDGMATSNEFSGKVWWRLSNFLVTRYAYVVLLEPGSLVSRSCARLSGALQAHVAPIGSSIATCQ